MSLLDSFAEAVERCDLSKVTSLIGSGSIDVNARLRVGFNFDINRAVPALVIAAARNHTELVGILLQSGAHIDDVDSCGRTACHFAVSHRNANMMALLLTHRPNLEIKSTSARKVTPLQISLADYQCTRISLMLLEAGASLKGVRKSHLCHFAASSTSAIQSLLNRGYVMSELRNDDACTPLHAAALQASCDSAAVNMLINVCGVDLEARNAAGLTCMQCTAVQSNVDALRCFVHAGADLTCVNQQGMTLLHCVRDYNCTLLLLAARADVNVRDRHGKTACHSALPTANWKLHALVAAGADLDVPDENGTTVRQLLSAQQLTVDADQVAMARRAISSMQLDFVRHRALQVCVGMQSRGLDALQMCEILLHACGPLARVISFHQWWAIATTVKHFRNRN